MFQSCYVCVFADAILVLFWPVSIFIISLYSYQPNSECRGLQQMPYCALTAIAVIWSHLVTCYWRVENDLNVRLWYDGSKTKSV